MQCPDAIIMICKNQRNILRALSEEKKLPESQQYAVNHVDYCNTPVCRGFRVLLYVAVREAVIVARSKREEKELQLLLRR